MFDYGKVYSKLSAKQISLIKPGYDGDGSMNNLAKIYFKFFGYPDIVSQRRYKMVEKLLNLKKGERILDAGCGNGIYLHEFGNKFGTNGVGVDARKNRISAAIKINNALAGDNSFIYSTLEKIELGRQRFDKAICLEVLEHIIDDSGVLKRISKNLVKKGKFIISVPMKGTALTSEQENDPHFKPEKYEHVRSGYEVKDLRLMAKKTGLEVLSIETYFFFISRFLVKIQQFLYKRNMVAANLILSPVLAVIASLDSVFKFYPRGYLIVLRKK